MAEEHAKALALRSRSLSQYARQNGVNAPSGRLSHFGASRVLAPLQLLLICVRATLRSERELRTCALCRHLEASPPPLLPLNHTLTRRALTSHERAQSSVSAPVKREAPSSTLDRAYEQRLRLRPSRVATLERAPLKRVRR